MTDPDNKSLPDEDKARQESRAKTEQAGVTKESLKKEHGGPKGLEPTRYGDWERNGRCTDF